MPIEAVISNAAAVALGDTLNAVGSALAPTAGTALATFTAPAAGTYTCKVTSIRIVTSGGTDDALDNNLRLLLNAVVKGRIPTTTGATATTVIDRVTCNGTDNLTVTVLANAGALNRISCSVHLTRIA